MNQLSLLRRKIVLLFLVVASGLVFSACAQQTEKEQTTTESTPKAGEVIHIGTNYMKANIYDFDAHPNKFVYKGDKPAIIDFYADWCGPCRRLAPKLKAIAEKYKDQIVVYKVNVDENPHLASVFGVQSIPMVLFVPLQGDPYMSTGDLPMDYIEETVGKITSTKPN